MQVFCVNLILGDKMEKIIRQVGTISRALDTIANLEFKDLKVSKGQYVHLVRIYENPGITLRQLSKITYIDETTCSRAVNNLEKQGLVYKQTLSDNKKNKLLYLTSQGEDTVQLILREHEYTNNKMIQSLNTDEVNMLSELLAKVAEPVLSDLIYVKKNGRRDY